MKLENGAWYLNDAARRMVAEQPELIRRVGVAVLGVAGRATPPNRGGASKGYASKAGRDALRRRIVSEILGEQPAKGMVIPTARPTRAGRVAEKSWKGPDVSFGGYRFVVPEKGSKLRVPYENPEKILSSRRFYRRGNVVRAQGPPLKGWPPRWVRANDLKAAINKRVARAGALASGLMPAALALRASDKAIYNLSKQPRHGWALLTHEGSVTELDMGNDWGDLVVGRRFLPRFSSYVNAASVNAIRNTENWFLKRIFG